MSTSSTAHGMACAYTSGNLYYQLRQKPETLYGSWSGIVTAESEHEARGIIYDLFPTAVGVSLEPGESKGTYRYSLTVKALP